jgi:flagellar biosynthetic protein FlhB
MANEDESGEDRTEEPSEQRRQEFRERGSVGQSRELVAAIILLAMTGALYFTARWSLKGLWSLFETSFDSGTRLARGDWSIETAMSIVQYALQALLYVSAPVGIAGLLAAVLGNIVQTGFLFTTKPLEPELEKLNPLKGLQRYMSAETLFDLAKALAKFALVSALLYPALKGWIRDAGTLWQLETQQIAFYLGREGVKLLFMVGLAMFGLAGADFAFQKFRYLQKLKMTKQEAKEDRKQSEGNPQIKARIRAMQRQRATRSMMNAVKKADVVITNPTHIAIALMFDRETMFAPKVVARGADHMAQQIKKIAREAGVPCVENVPLARALYKALKIGQFIPREMYNAVAEVLAYVYRLKGKYV